MYYLIIHIIILLRKYIFNMIGGLTNYVLCVVMSYVPTGEYKNCNLSWIHYTVKNLV